MSARTILKHVYNNGGMTFEQYQKIDRNLKERPHGEWEHWGSPFSDDSIANSIVCSLCKARYVEIEDEVFNFCPNCGAKMRQLIHGCSFASEECKKNPCADCGVREGDEK